MTHIKSVKMKKHLQESFCFVNWVSLLILLINISQAEVITGKINETLEENIVKFSPKVIQYFLTPDVVPDPQSTKLKVEISADEKATFHDPLLITIQQRAETNALELPFSFDDEPNKNSVIYRSLSTSLCFNAKRLKEGHKNVSITLRTSSPNPVKTHIKLMALRNLYLPLEKEYTVEVAPTHPTYLRFEFNDPTLRTVLLKATSKDPHCMTLSIQTPFCPVFDTESNVQYQGRWQTMSTQAATTIQKEGHFTTGFFVVLVVNKNDIRCGDHSYPKPGRRKTVTLFLQRVRPLENWMYFNLAIFLPAVIGLFVGIVTYLSLFFFRRVVERQMFRIAANFGNGTPLTRIDGTKSENDISSTQRLCSLEPGKQLSRSDDRLNRKRRCNCIRRPSIIEKLRSERFSSPTIKYLFPEDEEYVLAECSLCNESAENNENSECSERAESASVNYDTPAQCSSSLRKENKFRFISQSFQDALDSIFAETKTVGLEMQGEHKSTPIQNNLDVSFEMVDISGKKEAALGVKDGHLPSRVLSPLEIELNNKICQSEISFSPVRKIKTLKEYFAALKDLVAENDFSPEIDITALIKLRKSDKENVRRLKRYLWTAVTVAIFYAVPVYQLIIQYLMLYRSGNYDLCYYNFLCAIPFWIFVDFNHMCSNFNYIIFGVVFIFIVRKKMSMHKEIVNDVTNEILDKFLICSDQVSYIQCEGRDSSHEDNESMKTEIKRFLDSHGVPLHYEFYYTLAFVLIMEGFMSAAYHICPNQSTFQFDTCFMYVIAVLGILKIYQMRHPIYLGPSQVFLLISLFQLFIVLCLTVEQYRISMVVHFLKGLFTLAHIVWNGYFWIHCYAVGHINYDGSEDCNSKLIFKQLWPIFLNAHPTRMISPLLMLVIHTIIITEHYHDDFANYLLFLLLGTFIGHTLCYIIMKVMNGELKWWALCQSVFYFTLLATVGPFAMKYFHAKLTQWDKTSAQSRVGNQECNFYEFYPFYDQHDIWHFLSAGAVFFYYMFLLTLDDGVAAIHQSLIPVF